MNSRKVVLATTNVGKIREISAALQSLGVEILGLNNFPHIAPIPETGNTFAENALIKARAVCEKTGLISIADDSGLVVHALDGAPGIFSARYGDDLPPLAAETRDQRNIRKLLLALGNFEDRSARFETWLAVIAPGGKKLLVSGQWPGIILKSPRGANGFGYDPVFFDPRLQKSAAELTLQEKNNVSHRGNAIHALVAGWPDFVARL